MNLLKNNGWKCLWRGHPAQPTDQLKPTSTDHILVLFHPSPRGVLVDAVQSDFIEMRSDGIPRIYCVWEHHFCRAPGPLSPTNNAFTQRLETSNADPFRLKPRAYPRTRQAAHSLRALMAKPPQGPQQRDTRRWVIEGG